MFIAIECGNVDAPVSATERVLQRATCVQNNPRSGQWKFESEIVNFNFTCTAQLV